MSFERHLPRIPGHRWDPLNTLEIGMGALKKTESTKVSNYRRTRLILFIFKIIGLAPLNVTKEMSGDSSRKIGVQTTSVKFVYARSDWVYTILRSIVMCGVSSISVPRLMTNEYIYKSSLTTTIEVTEAIVGIALSNVLWLMICNNRKKMVGFLNRLAIVESTIRKYLESRKLAISSFFGIGVFVSMVTLWIAIIITDYIAYESTIIDWFNDIVPGIIMTGCITQYALIVKKLEFQFRNLNRAIVDSSKSSVVKRTFRSMIEGDSNLGEYQNPIFKINEFRRVHTELYDITNGVSDFYSLPMLFTISLSNFEIVYNSYYVIMPLILEVDNDRISVVVNGTLWLIVLSLPIAFLTKAVDNISDEMRRTVDAIHKVVERSSINREDKAELKQFTIELLQRRVYFTAYGLFSLDSTLLHSMFNTIITYIVLLFQFQISASKYQTKPARSTHVNMMVKKEVQLNNQ